MARKPREEVAGGIYHVHARGNNRQDIYFDDVDREQYLEFLALTIRRQRWECLAYCQMTNHVHLVIETPEPNLGEGMMDFHGKYARWFNVRHGRVGHLFQRRYGSDRIKDDAHLEAVLAYVAVNPVAARICKRPESWRWSSHTATVTGTSKPWLATDRLHSHLAVDGGNPVAGYLQIVEAKLSFLD